MQILLHSQIIMTTMQTYSEVPAAQTRSALRQLARKLDGQGCCTVSLRSGLVFEIYP